MHQMIRSGVQVQFLGIGKGRSSQGSSCQPPQGQIQLDQQLGGHLQAVAWRRKAKSFGGSVRDNHGARILRCARHGLRIPPLRTGAPRLLLPRVDLRRVLHHAAQLLPYQGPTRRASTPQHLHNSFLTQ